MFKLLATVTLLSIICLGAAEHDKNYHISYDSSVNYVKGKSIDITNAPYMVAIAVTDHQNRSNTRTCGGSIISDRWIMTAAQCCISTDPSDYSISIGTDTLPTNSVISLVENVTIHEGFQKNTTMVMNDIALIKVRHLIDTRASQTHILLYPYTALRLSYRYVNVTVWGPSQPGTENRDLRKVKAFIANNDECHRLFDIDYIPPGTFCAVARDQICIGNAGSPLVERNYKVGIASYGPCNSFKDDVAAAVYTDIAYFADWIKGITGFYGQS